MGSESVESGHKQCVCVARLVLNVWREKVIFTFCILYLMTFTKGFYSWFCTPCFHEGENLILLNVNFSSIILRFIFRFHFFHTIRLCQPKSEKKTEISVSVSVFGPPIRNGLNHKSQSHFRCDSKKTQHTKIITQRTSIDKTSNA